MTQSRALRIRGLRLAVQEVIINVSQQEALVDGRFVGGCCRAYCDLQYKQFGGCLSGVQNLTGYASFSSRILIGLQA